MTDEDLILDQLVAQAPESAAAARYVEQFVACLRPSFPKADWAYRRYLANLGLSATYQPDFQKRHEDAWSHFARSVHRACTIAALPLAPVLREGKILAGWHRRDYPLALSALKKEDILLCVAREVPWINSLIEPSHLCNIFDRNTPFRLVRHFKSGKSVMAMLDYGYPDTSNTAVSFLGEQAHFPIGLIRLAQKFGYDFAMVDIQGDSIVADEYICASGNSPALVAGKLSAYFEQKISEAPENWLLWASMDYCWVEERY